MVSGACGKYNKPNDFVSNPSFSFKCNVDWRNIDCSSYGPGWFPLLALFPTCSNLSQQFGGGYPGPNCFKSITISYGGKQAQATIVDEASLFSEEIFDALT